MLDAIVMLQNVTLTGGEHVLRRQVWHNLGMKIQDTDTGAKTPQSKVGPTSDPKPDSPETDPEAAAKVPREIGGRDGPDPTRYGDWEKAGRCIDF